MRTSISLAPSAYTLVLGTCLGSMGGGHVSCDGSLPRPDIHCSGAGRTYHGPHLLYIPLLSFDILSYTYPYDLTLGTVLTS